MRDDDNSDARDEAPWGEDKWYTKGRLRDEFRMKSERGRFAMLAHTWLALDPVFLDTETTGLDAGAQALEIGLVNARGERIFETRLKPTVDIDPAAAAAPYRHRPAPAGYFQC